MKITPLASATGEPGHVLGHVELGSSTSADKKANALKAFRGEAQGTVTPKETIEEQAQRIQKKRVLKMNTNATPERYLSQEEATQNAVQEPQAAISEPIETANQPEETKPLSPQFAAIARQRRALQVKEREIAEREKALQSAQPQSSGIDVAQLKADPLSVLQQAGVSYDDLTQAILGNKSGYNPELNALKEQIQNLEKALDNKFSDRDNQAEQQVLNQMRREADILSAKSDDYEMVRTTKSQSDVVDLIRRTYKKTGEIMDVPEALQLVEEELQNEVLRLARLKKIQGKLSPSQDLQQQQPQMRTLTSRDGSTPQLSRRDRAMAAFSGNLRKG